MNLANLVGEEVKKVPILKDILEHEVLGREYKSGELAIIRQIKKRFGSVPKWGEARLEELSAEELKKLSVRLLDAKSIESLLK